MSIAKVRLVIRLLHCNLQQCTEYQGHLRSEICNEQPQQLRRSVHVCMLIIADNLPLQRRHALKLEINDLKQNIFVQTLLYLTSLLIRLVQHIHVELPILQVRNLLLLAYESILGFKKRFQHLKNADIIPFLQPLLIYLTAYYANTKFAVIRKKV